MLQETIDLAVREKQLPPKDLAQVTVDPGAPGQEKNITYPTDSKLLHTAIRKLAGAALERGVQLRQSYLRVAKRAATRVSRYAHAKQFRPGAPGRELRRLRTWVGRLIRDVTRKVGKPDVSLTQVLERAERLRSQQPQDSHKLYSWHEPEVPARRDQQRQGPPTLRVRPEGCAGHDQPQSRRAGRSWPPG